MQPIKKKIIQIHGITKAHRDEQFEKIKDKLTNRGWKFIKYQSGEGIKASIDGSSAEFHRLQPTSFANALLDWYDDRKTRVWLIGIGLLLMPLLYTCHQIAEESNKKTQTEAEVRRQKYEVDKQIKLKNAGEVAVSLKNFLRNNGVNEALVIDVKVDEFGSIVLVISNSWLERPKYEQKQMRQAIEMSLRKIAHPDGWPFYIVDYLGNRI